MNLGCDESAGIEGAAGSEAQDEHHDACRTITRHRMDLVI